LVVFLDMEPEAADRLIAERAKATGQSDIHEKDKDYLHRCHGAYLELAEKYGWARVKCSSGGEPLPVEEIHSKVYEIVEAALR
jgi:dTMP kinase